MIPAFWEQFLAPTTSTLDTYTCWKRLMLSRMLNCCQRLEKLTFPSIRSGFPRCTNVRSWRMRPLWRQKEKTCLPIQAGAPRQTDQIHSQVRDARRLHLGQSSPVRPEGGGAVDQSAVLLQALTGTGQRCQQGEGQTFLQTNLSILSPLRSVSATPASWWGLSPERTVLPSRSWSYSTFLSALMKRQRGNL